MYFAKITLPLVEPLVQVAAARRRGMRSNLLEVPAHAELIEPWVGDDVDDYAA